MHAFSVASLKLTTFGATQKNVNRPQCVQNTLARVDASHALPRGTHSFDILQDLHWLPIDQRIEFKLATLTYNILNSSQPAYLRSVLNCHTLTRSLHSANTNLLSVPRVCTTFASRGFSIAAPTVRNSLPFSIRSSTSADTFRRLLKTLCFQQAYCSPQQLSQVPQIWPLADIVHSKYCICLLTHSLNHLI